MSNRDVGVVAQATSSRLPGEVAHTASSMQPQRLPLRSDSHNCDARPKRPPKRPLNEPGSTHSDSRLKRKSQVNSAGLALFSSPSSPADKRPGGQDRAQAHQRVTTKTPYLHALRADTAIKAQAPGHAKMPVSSARQLPTPPRTRGVLGSESSEVVPRPQQTGPAAPLSQEHEAIAGLRRPNTRLLSKRKARSGTHYVADATLSAAPQHGVCLRTTTSSVHKHARAAMGLCSPFGQPKSAHPSGNSKDGRRAPSRTQARWRSQPKSDHPAKRPPKASRAGTPSHDACRETHKPSEHCYQRMAPSLLPGGRPHRARGHQRPGRPGRQYRAIAEAK